VPAEAIQHMEEGKDFAAKWQNLPQATDGDKAVGTPVDAWGNCVVLHIGRGAHVLHTLKVGEKIPELGLGSEKRKGVVR